MKRRQEGSAMVMILCVMAVVVALCMALLLSASVLTTNAARSNQKEQCRIAAITISDALKDEIETTGNYSTQPGAGGDTDTLAGKLHTVFSNDWVRYDKNAGDVQQIQIDAKGIYNYVMSSSALPDTETKVQMYWMHDDMEDMNTEDIGARMEKFKDVILYMRVTCQVGQEASTIINTFGPTNLKLNDEGTDFSWQWNYEGHTWERSDD